jgi:hypothetical protein
MHSPRCGPAAGQLIACEFKRSLTDPVVRYPEDGPGSKPLRMASKKAGFAQSGFNRPAAPGCVVGRNNGNH